MLNPQADAPFRGANIDRITDDLFIGGDLSRIPEKRELQILGIIEAGITHIIDMRVEANDSHIWRDHGIKYINLGTDDRVGHHIPAEPFDQAVWFARQAREAGGKVLAHCHMGVNRGPSAGYAILLDQGIRECEAFDLIRTKRPQAAIWYAEDAFRAHLRRRNVNPHATTRLMNRLRRHINAVFSPSDRAKVNHYIAGQHSLDADERHAAMLERIMNRAPGTRWEGYRRPARHDDLLQWALDSLDERDGHDDGHGYVYRPREHEVDNIAG